MAKATQTIDGQSVVFSSVDLGTSQLAQSILNAPAISLVTGGNGTLTNSFFVTTGAGPATVVGGAQVTVGVLAGQNAQFQTGVSQASEIVAGDNSASAIVNNNLNGSLIAFTGSGGNALYGGGVVNAFQTGLGGSDLVSFVASAGQPVQMNLLASHGQDYVTISGAPTGSTQTNTVDVEVGGTDGVVLAQGANLNFINNGAGVSTVTATAGSVVNAAGYGSSVLLDSNNGSKVYGNGAVTFNVSTAGGNVTLVGSGSGGVDIFNFDKTAGGASHAVDVIGKFASTDFVNLVGYEPGSYTATVVNGSTVLTLSDNTQLVFAGIGDVNQVIQHVNG